MLRLCLLDVCVFSFDVICFLVLCVIYFNNVPEDLTNETAVEHFNCCFIYKKLISCKGRLVTLTVCLLNLMIV